MKSIAERIKEGMEIRNLKQADLVEMTGISKGALSSYISGHYLPKQNNIFLISKALNVNESWLMGNDVPMERLSNIFDSKSNIKYNNSDLRLQKIIDCYNGMTERGKDFLTDQAEICYKQFAQSTSKEGSA